MAAFRGTVLAVLCLAACPGGPVLAADKRCDAPEGTAGSPVPLSHAAVALRPGGTLDVLVVGSATVFGPAASLEAGTAAREAVRAGGQPGNGAPPGGAAGSAPLVASSTAFPMVMGRVIQASVPGVTVKVSVRGGRSMTASDMVEVLRKALAEHPYQLVVWQTGTLEAARNVQPGDFAQSLADGQQLVRDAGADLVLVDPQYSRFFQTNANIDPYLQAFSTAAGMSDVAWFRRYDLMREWVSSGQIDLEHTPRAQRGAAVDLLHDCLGAQLAQFVLQSARS